MANLTPSDGRILDRVKPREPARRPTRVKVTMPIMLEVSPGRTVKAIIDDLSKDGFRLRSRAPLEVGQRVKIHMPRETVDCELLWVDGQCAGGVFAETAQAAIW